MAIVQSTGSLVEAGSPWTSFSHPGRRLGLELSLGHVEDYAAIYRTQPNVRLVVRFLARNIASLPLKGYRRLGPANRRELERGDGELADVLRSPFPAAPKPPSRHRFVRTLMEDLAIFDRWYALLVRNTNTDRLNVVRLPPQMVEPKGGSFLGPAYYEISGVGVTTKQVAPADMLHLFGHDPANPNDGISPLEALRRVLAEDSSAGEYREQFWKNAARVPGVLKRPVEAAKWSDPARTRFLEDWRATWTGSGTEAGGTPVLEEGMEFEATGFSAKESEYLGARRLTREEAAALYHVQPAFVGILENANFANMREQHVGLYVDTLGPWLDFITQELEIQLLPQLVGWDPADYIEFTLEEKLRGNFEEQAAALSTAVGAPIMLRDEARALRNLPPLPDGQGQRIVTPLNVLEGGLASPRDTAPPTPALAGRTGGAKTRPPHGEKTGLPHYLHGWEAKHVEVLTGFFTRQRDAVLSRLGARSPLATAFDTDRWNGELESDLLALSSTMADELGGDVAGQIGGTWDLARAMPWLSENARIAAEAINAATLGQLADAVGGLTASRAGGKTFEDVLGELGGLDLLDDETPDDPTDPVLSARGVFDLAVAARAAQIATTRATSIGQWSRREGAEQSGARTKTWNVNASPSRHAELDGETVPIADDFSNGAAWPGDPSLGADENAGCLCSLTFG